MKPRLISCFHADSCFGGEVSFVLCFGVLALPLGRSPLRLLAGGEAVTFAIHLQDMDMMRNVSTTLRQPAFEFKLGFSAFGLAG